MELDVDAAVAWVGQGGVLAYPTETLWGLGVDATSDAAVGRLRAFKGRAPSEPISILVTGLPLLDALGFRLEAPARRLADEFWPGPLTLVLPCRGGFAAGVARLDGAVGVRCSPHAGAAELAARCAEAGTGPLTATSCNRSGEPAARSREEARRVCAHDPGLRLLAGGEDPRSDVGPDAPAAAAGSTVVDLSGPRPAVLRWGALSAAVLTPVLQELAAA